MLTYLIPETPSLSTFWESVDRGGSRSRSRSRTSDGMIAKLNSEPLMGKRVVQASGFPGVEAAIFFFATRQGPERQLVSGFKISWRLSIIN